MCYLHDILDRASMTNTGRAILPFISLSTRWDAGLKSGEAQFMPSEISRGIKFGIGFALGVGFILTLFLLSLSMCAGHLHRRMMERMEEMMPREWHPAPETGDDPVALGFHGQLLFVAAGDQAAAFAIRSTAFTSGGTIPEKHACDGPDVSPPLSWTEPPAGTKSLALIMDDPDAPVGTWVHWVLYNLPAATRELSEGIPITETLASGARQGTNDFRKIGYGGPCPPAGPAHRYFFKLYALDTEVKLLYGMDYLSSLAPKDTKEDLEAAMAGHILAQAELIGRYSR
jgi:Raf kinase inhibitor-like YbhB/YbcL family protein